MRRGHIDLFGKRNNRFAAIWDDDVEENPASSPFPQKDRLQPLQEFLGQSGCRKSYMDPGDRVLLNFGKGNHLIGLDLEALFPYIQDSLDQDRVIPLQIGQRGEEDIRE